MLFFAVFLGSWSPMSLNIGYGSTSVMPGGPNGQPSVLAKHIPEGSSPMVPNGKDARVGPYQTLSGKLGSCGFFLVKGFYLVMVFWIDFFFQSNFWWLGSLKCHHNRPASKD